MWDKKLSINFPRELKIAEHHAPTDESVKLLREMEQKALDSITEKLTLDNEVRGTVFVFQDHKYAQRRVRITFSVNGKQYTVEESLDDEELLAHDKHKWFGRLRETLAHAIVEQFTVNLVGKLAR